MEDMLFFIFTYTILVFIWGYIFARRRQKDKATNAFLFFLAVILLWMVLSISNFYDISSRLYMPMQKIYWVILLNMATAFLYFIYIFLNRDLDLPFYFLLVLNTFTIIVRYYFEMDYSQANFWRMDQLTIATTMATIFTLPMLWAIILLIIDYKNTTDPRLKKSIRLLSYGIGAATAVSIFSEYIGPIFVAKFKTSSFMYLAILTLVFFLVLAVVKEKFLNVEMEYIYAELFLNSNDGIILIDKNAKIVSINDSAKSALKTDRVEKNMCVIDLIPGYDFAKDKARYEISIEVDGQINYLSLSQNVIEIDNKSTMKLLHIINITDMKVKQLTKMRILSDKTMKDPLTGLYNRRYIDEVFTGDSLGTGENLTLMFIDIDNFKKVNDRHGHSVGDEILRLVASSIRDSIRTDEVAIRYGGDEFLIILKDIRIQDAYKIANRIRESFEASIASKDKVKSDLSLSIGLSEGNKDIWSLIEEADMAMYHSKSKGKNQCTIYEDGTLGDCGPF